MTLAFAAVIGAVMLLVCSALVWYAWRRAEWGADARLRAAARQVAEALSDRDAAARMDELAEAERGQLQPDGIALLIAGAAGRVTHRSQRAVPPWPLRQTDEWRVLSARLGSDTVVLGLPWGRAEAALRGQTIVLFSLGLFVVILSAGGAWLLVGRTLVPIDALAGQAEAAGAERLRVSLAAPSQDAELVRLVGTLNGLLARIAEAAEARGRFHGAASHELRTPLQALCGHLELALQRERTPAEYREFIGEARHQAQRLVSLARDLLLLNQIERGACAAPEPVDLGDVCERALRQVAGIAAAQHLRVALNVPVDTMVQSPPTHADMLIRNLVENAAKYASPGSALEVAAAGDGAGVRLEVRNECAVVPDWDPDRLFEPFYRPDGSRNSRTGGTGLGLAICRAIAGANGWKLELNQSAGVVTAAVRFPRPG